MTSTFIAPSSATELFNLKDLTEMNRIKSHLHDSPLASSSKAIPPPAVLVAPIAKSVFVLGTRNSKLAMVQTELVKKMLEEKWPGQEIRIQGMVSSDRPR